MQTTAGLMLATLGALLDLDGHCLGFTRRGSPCRRKLREGETCCWQH